VIVAQGTEGGGHVGLMGMLPLVRAVAPLPVVAAGGIADGAGLAAVLALGAEGGVSGNSLPGHCRVAAAQHVQASDCGQ
jgi:NAD(P)H-dependent flavin oxidoreductase YrpB (nitropropane dioxygenase family)